MSENPGLCVPRNSGNYNLDQRAVIQVGTLCQRAYWKSLGNLTGVEKIGVIRNHRLSGLEVCVIELVTSLSVTASWFLITLLDFDR